MTDATVLPESVAYFAIMSVIRSRARNAIGYLALNIAQGIITPITFACRAANLRCSGAVDLGAAERVLLSSFTGPSDAV